MKCRDCGGEGQPFGYVGMRADICSPCMDVRGRVIKAVESGEMSLPDFQNYQRNGLRIKRLIKMGHGRLVTSL